MRLILGREPVRARRGGGLTGCGPTSLLVYLFLYAPIALIVLFSFNAGRHAASFEGFSTAVVRQGAGQPVRDRGAVDQPERRRRQLGRSGDPVRDDGGAGAAARARPAARVFDALIYVAIMMPGIVIGIATLIALVTVFDVREPGAGGSVARRPASRRSWGWGWAR